MWINTKLSYPSISTGNTAPFLITFEVDVEASEQCSDPSYLVDRHWFVIQLW